MNLDHFQHEQFTVISIDGNVDSSTANELEKYLNMTLEDGAKNLVIDAGKMDYISSAGLRVFLVINQLVTRGGGRFLLAGLNPFVYEIFDLAGFTQVFNIYKTFQEALAGTN